MFVLFCLPLFILFFRSPAFHLVAYSNDDANVCLPARFSSYILLPYSPVLLLLLYILLLFQCINLPLADLR